MARLLSILQRLFVLAIVWVGAAGIAIAVNASMDDTGVSQVELENYVRDHLRDYAAASELASLRTEISSAADEVAPMKRAVVWLFLAASARDPLTAQFQKAFYFASASQTDWELCLDAVAGRAGVDQATVLQQATGACERVHEAFSPP